MANSLRDTVKDMEKLQTEQDPLSEIEALTEKLKSGDRLELVLPPGQTSVSLMPIEMVTLPDMNPTGSLNDFFSVKLNSGSKLEVLETTATAIKLKVLDYISAEFSIAKRASIWRRLKLQT